MQIIVDKMPTYPDECPFSHIKNDNWVCGQCEYPCNIDKCDVLVPITNFCAVSTFKVKDGING